MQTAREVSTGHRPAAVPQTRRQGGGGPGRDDLLLVVIVVAGMALLASLVAVGFGYRAIGESKDSSGTAAPATAAASEVTTVTLTEFAINPARIETAAGTLRVVNRGSVPHDLGVRGTDLMTPTLAPGESADLALGSLAAGTYEVVCHVPGHEAAGMRAELVVTGPSSGGATTATPAGQGHAMTAEEMDAAMAAATRAFPARTQGQGGQPLAPTVLADGTRQFELTSRIVRWEVEPGRFVDAWTYNGTVPGPTLRVATGERIRVVLRNELPESTAIHFHGLRTPNAMDGVPDITQAPVKPGETFVYEFVAQGPAVGMYHSHHNAAVQVPNGLAGTILVGDLALPEGVTVSQELPMMLNDAGTIGFSLNGKSFPATAPVVARQGEWLLVHYLNEGLMAHPMHLHGMEQLVVAKDGFPVPQPYRADTVNVAPGERYSVLVHADEPGTWAWHCHILTHAERETGMFGMVTALVVQ